MSAFGEAAASVLAAAQGHRVEVLSLRSQTDQVFANPDGTLTREQFLEPVRVRRGEAWLDVDSTLVRLPDGSWGPRVSAVGLAFSQGGSEAAVTMRAGNTTLRLFWPEALPVPSVDGDTLTYSEVYPGVDLQLAAVGASFTQHLVVKSKAAGLDARVRTITLKAKVSGGSMVQDGVGYMVRDIHGRELLRGAQPVMWDSTVRPAGATGAVLAEAIRRHDEGDRQAAMGLSVGKDILTVRPNIGLLDDANAVFPMVLDPTTSPAIYNWAMVNATYPTVSYYNFTGADEGVGYNNFESPANKKRVFYSFTTSGYNSKQIISATLRAFETYSASCAAGTVNAYLSGDIPSGVTWNTQPGKLLSTALDSWSVKAGRSDCNPGGKTAAWDVTTGVKNRVSAQAARSTFLLQGASESTYSSWMRFGGPKNATASKRPSLSVTYNTPPRVPLQSAMWTPTGTTPCVTSAPGPSVNPSTGAAESMYAKISDADGDNLGSQIQTSLASTGSAVANTNFTSRASGSVISTPIPASLADGVYYFRAAATDGKISSGFGDKCFFTVDRSVPTTPTITSDTWQQGVLAPTNQTTGNFTMTSAGATAMSYRWDSVPTEVSSAATNGLVTFSATSARTWDKWLATGKDAAGNTSGTAGFIVKRTQPGKLAEYLFNGIVPTSELPATCAGPAYEATCDTANQQLNSESALTDPDAVKAYKFDLPNDQSNFQAGRWSDDVGNNALSLDGSTSSVATLASRPVVNSDSFTIGLWVRLDDNSQSRTLLAQERDVNPGVPESAALSYDVGYDAVSDRFVGRVMDGAGAVIATAVDTLPATLPSSDPLSRAGTWTYLAFVFDKAASTVRLDAMSSAMSDPPDSDFTTYTQGTAVSVAGMPGAGMGAFTIGGGTSAAGDRAAWVGAVDNLAIWQGIPTANTTLLFNANARR